MMTRTKAPQRIIAAVAIAIAAFPAPRLDAATLSSGDAVGLAAEWLGAPDAAAHSATRRSAASGGGRQRARMRPSGAPSGAVRTCSIGGTNLFHLVALEGGGFVAVPADDSMTPILGFSASGGLPDENPANPFWALVGADAEAAITGRRRGERASSAYAFEDVVATPTTRTAARTTRAAATNPIRIDSGIDDLRVAPFVQSRWDQAEVNGKKVYNYYTPNGDLCGCVATAMAQLMRFHKFPTASISNWTFTCHSRGAATNLVMKGGTYDWDNMPLEPDFTIADTQREAIGRICFDAGVAMRMKYNTNGSSTCPAFACAILKDIFGYVGAECYTTPSTIDDNQTKNGILANIDAGFPVILGLYGNAEHAIIADGYGYVDGTLFCHLNMGWGANEAYWYAIPDVEAGGYTFFQVGDIIYNVFPNKTGELVTGRVLDASGEPVTKAAVTARTTYKVKKGASAITTSETIETSDSGHYALFVPRDISSSYSCSVTISATSMGLSSTNTVSKTVSPSSSPRKFDYENDKYDGYTYGSGLSIGNSWGNDLYLAPTNKPFTLVFGW